MCRYVPSKGAKRIQHFYFVLTRRGTLRGVVRCQGKFLFAVGTPWQFCVDAQFLCYARLMCKGDSDPTR